MALLLDYLSRPFADEWRRLVLSAVSGLAAAADWDTPLAADDVGDVVAGSHRRPGAGHASDRSRCRGPRLAIDHQQRPAHRDDPRRPAGTGRRRALDGHRRARRLDWPATRACIADAGRTGSNGPTCSSSSRARVVRWSSRPPRKRTSSRSRTSGWSALRKPRWSRAPTSGSPCPPRWRRSWHLLDDEAVVDVVRAALERGAPAFVAGLEVDGEPLEAAWPDLKVAVAAPGQEALRRSRLGCASAAEWSVDELVRVIGSGADGQARTVEGLPRRLRQARNTGPSQGPGARIDLRSSDPAAASGAQGSPPRAPHERRRPTCPHDPDRRQPPRHRHGRRRRGPLHPHVGRHP